MCWPFHGLKVFRRDGKVPIREPAGIRTLSTLTALALVTGWCFASVTCATAQESYKDVNAIIRGLAPIEYLPEHSGEKPAIDLDIRFTINSADLTLEAERQLDELGSALKSAKLEALRFRIVGHTDAAGTDEYNKNLSEMRAQAVKAYLVTMQGIDQARLEWIGVGEEQLKNPLDGNDPANRRVQILSLGKITKPSGIVTSKQKKIEW